MTYDWGWQGGPPMAISPIGPVKEVLQYAKSQMPPQKIMMGQNLYGFDWKLPFKQGNPPAKAVSSVAAVALARKYNVPIRYDFTAQAPHFNYFDENGVQHEVWFEDSRSIQSKFNLMKEQGIGGISYWKIGLPFPQNWRLLVENFTITKKADESQLFKYFYNIIQTHKKENDDILLFLTVINNWLFASLVLHLLSFIATSFFRLCSNLIWCKVF